MQDFGLLSATASDSLSAMEDKRNRISAPVWVVDNDDVRQTIRFALATHGMNVRTFPSGEAFLEEVDLDRPGVLVLDLHMKGIGGLEVQEKLRSAQSPIAVIFLSGSADMRSVVRAMENGAVSFFEKPVDPEVLYFTIGKALDICEALQEKRTLKLLLDNLSRREREVLELLYQGKRNQEVAELLNLSTRTVEVHRAHISRKLGSITPIQLLSRLNAANERLAKRFGWD